MSTNINPHPQSGHPLGGPRTPQGKARSSQNARKHGLSAATLTFPDALSRQIYESMEAALRAEVDPHGELENAFFDQALFAHWNLHQCRIRESEYLTAQNEPGLRLVDRYIRRHEASFRRAIAELRLLQTNRALAAPPNEPLAAASAAAPLADKARVRRYADSATAVSLNAALARLLGQQPAPPHLEEPDL